MTLQIIHRPAGAECAAILAALPEWFGLPASNAAYAERAEREGAFLALEGGVAKGIMILKAHGEGAVEVYLLAVRPEAHRHGVGRALIETALAECRARGAPYLTVKTRGPSLPYEPYERTRAFYLAMGFTPLEEFIEIWGPENPALFMVKALSPRP